MMIDYYSANITTLYAIWLEDYEPNTELGGEILQDNEYEFDYKQIKYLHSPLATRDLPMPGKYVYSKPTGKGLIIGLTRALTKDEANDVREFQSSWLAFVNRHWAH